MKSQNKKREKWGRPLSVKRSGMRTISLDGHAMVGRRREGGAGGGQGKKVDPKESI